MKNYTNNVWNSRLNKHLLPSFLKICVLPFFLGIFFISGAWAQEAESQAKEHIEKNLEKLGLTRADIQDWIVTNEYMSKHNGITHLYLNQSYQGIPVENAVINVNINREGLVLNVGNRFIPGIKDRIRVTKANLSPKEALVTAIGFIQELTDQETKEEEAPSKVSESPKILPDQQQKGLSDQKAVFKASNISLEPIPVRLVYLPTEEGKVYLAWEVIIYTPDAKHCWNIRVDAATGDVLAKNDMVQHDHWPAPEMPSSVESESVLQNPFGPLESLLPPGPGKYRVYEMPVESPNHSSPPSPDDGRSLEVNPADNMASPYKWHDTNGHPGAEYTITRGNNVHAYEDRDANNAPGYSPDGGGSLSFDYSLNPSEKSLSEIIDDEDAAITNLFYWNNVIHDVFYRYGFDEAAGNFQVNNYGNGGLGNDDVRAEAQDGGGVNNANFFTPSDGFRPRMQMYNWTVSPPDLFTVNFPEVIAGNYSAELAGFGPAPTMGVTGDLELVDDGVYPGSDGCSSLPSLSGKIALIDRGGCAFITKVFNAQVAGAIGVVVVNNIPGAAPFGMGGSSNAINIPSIMIGYEDGNTLKNELLSGPVNTTIEGDRMYLDGDLDNGIITHEYGHGISNRLTGGPGTTFCLFNAEQMGEGWSDYFGMMLTMSADDLGTDGRGVGTYALNQPVDGVGIRNYPYSTDMGVNPTTYKDVANSAVFSQPHGIGSIWAEMLWEMTWALIDKYGFDPDLYNGNGGNNIALQLVVDGLKLQPCSPGFVDGRDAILQADEINNNGANVCLIWEAFAKRGLGFSADQGSSYSRFDGSDAYDLPPVCECFENISCGNGPVPKVELCHVNDEEGTQTICVPLSAVNAHLAHGDQLGSCEDPCILVDPFGGAPQESINSEKIGFGEVYHTVYPNPFSNQITVEFQVKQSGFAKLQVLDIRGKVINTLFEGMADANQNYSYQMQTNKLPAGIYSTMLQTQEGVFVKKIILQR